MIYELYIDIVTNEIYEIDIIGNSQLPQGINDDPATGKKHVVTTHLYNVGEIYDPNLS